jgi:hypothetical protein
MKHCCRYLLMGALAILPGAPLGAGEREAGAVQLDSESFNAGGASFAAGGEVELGWTLAQHGLHESCGCESAAALGLQNGFWTQSEALFAGTVFMFR